MSLNDNMDSFLKSRRYEGALNDKYSAYLKDEGSTLGELNDKEQDVLTNFGYNDTLPDNKNAQLALFGYNGALNDRLNAAWGSTGLTGSALNLNFLNEAEELDPRITYSNATGGTRVNSAGLIEIATGAEQITQVALNTQGTWGITQPTSGVVSFSAAGVRINSADGTYAGITQIGAQPTTGKVYKYSINILSAASGSVAVAFGGVQTGSISATGVTEGYLIAVSTASFELKRNGVCDVTVVSLSIKLVTDAPRFDYNPVTLAPRGLLIEEARTNLCLQSSTYNGNWSVTDITYGTSGVSPSGASDAQLIVEGTLGTALLSNTNVALTASTAYTHSIYVKRVNTDWVKFVIAGPGNTNGANIWVNTSLSVASTWSAAGSQNGQSFAIRGAGTASTASVTPVGNGWLRVVMTCICSTDTTITMSVASAAADASATRVNGAQYYLWGAQSETGAALASTTFPTSYIPTTTTAVTRAADVASMTGTNFSSWFNATEGTFVAGFDCPSNGTGYFTNLYGIGTASDRITAYTYNGTMVVFEDRIASSVVANPTVTGIGTAAFKVASGYAANNINSAANGTLGTLDTACALPASMTDIGLGQSIAGAGVTGARRIQRLTYFNKRLPDNTLKALSA